jgi:plasmid maintenance system antidote protein VapI
VDAIIFRMEQAGLRPRDLVPYLGTAARVSEVLNRKRQLSKQMICALHAGLGIPLASLLGVEGSPLAPFDLAVARNTQKTITTQAGTSPVLTCAPLAAKSCAA